MGLKQGVEGSWLARLSVVRRPPQVYAPNGAFNLFNITGGPVWILGFFFFADEATGIAATMAVTVSGGAIDGGAAVIQSAAGTFCVWTLGAVAATANLANAPMPALAARPLMDAGILSIPGVIQTTVAAGPITGLHTFYVVFYRMAPEADISVA